MEGMGEEAAKVIGGVRGLGMEQRITGFHKDAEEHWVAELECGHDQHVRHNPPWECRPWVVTSEGRESRLGVILNCIKCDDGAPVDRPSVAKLT